MVGSPLRPSASRNMDHMRTGDESISSEILLRYTEGVGGEHTLRHITAVVCFDPPLGPHRTD